MASTEYVPASPAYQFEFRDAKAGDRFSLEPDGPRVTAVQGQFSMTASDGTRPSSRAPIYGLERRVTTPTPASAPVQTRQRVNCIACGEFRYGRYRSNDAAVCTSCERQGY